MISDLFDILFILNFNIDTFIYRNFEYIPIKGYGFDPYFRSAAALSVAPPPLPVHLAACEGLAGGS